MRRRRAWCSSPARRPGRSRSLHRGPPLEGRFLTSVSPDEAVALRRRSERPVVP
jgi:hypothetical protein